MRICLSLILTAFVVMFSYGVNAAEPGEIVVTEFLCEDEQGVLAMADAATQDEGAWFKTAQEVIQAGTCDEYMFLIPVVVTDLVLAFDGFNGPGEVWHGLAGPKKVPVFVIVGAKKKPSA